MAMRSRKSAIRSALVVTAILSLATGAYFAFGDGILSRLIDQGTKIQVPHKDHVAELRAQVDRMSGQFLGTKQSEQQLAALLGAQIDRIGQLEKNISALSDLLTANTIKPERIAPPPNTVNFVASSDHEALSQSHELPAKARWSSTEYIAPLISALHFDIVSQWRRTLLDRHLLSKYALNLAN
jgi:hypothetical protein